MVMDEQARAALRPVWLRLARRADAIGVRPGHLTGLGLVLGVAAAAAAAMGAWWWALGLWLASRVPDGVDGVLARLQGADSDVGGFLDLMADFAVYGGFVLGVGIGAPSARVAAAALLLTYYLNGSAFLATSALAEKRRANVAAGERSLQFVRGLTEGAETIVAHALFALAGAVRPDVIDDAVWVFAALVAVTVGQRVTFAWRVLRG